MSGTGDTPDTPTTPEAIEADIARQRDELAATVSQLQAKLDVKAQAKHKVGEIKDQVTTDTGKPRPDLALAAFAALALVVGLVVWRKRR